MLAIGLAELLVIGIRLAVVLLFAGAVVTVVATVSSIAAYIVGGSK